MMGDALGHVENEIQQMVRVDIDRAGKIRVMRFKRRDLRHQQDLSGPLAPPPRR
jgi:hypothetical protein